MPLTGHAGRARALADFRGKVVIASVFYTSCPYMCPLVIDTERRSERTLDAAARAGVAVLLVSLDAKRDDPGHLAEQVTKHKLDTARWTLARTDAGHVRKLAAALGIRYRELADGEFNHASMLDRAGRIDARTETIGKIDPAFIDALERALAEP